MDEKKSETRFEKIARILLIIAIMFSSITAVYVLKQESNGEDIDISSHQLIFIKKGKINNCEEINNLRIKNNDSDNWINITYECTKDYNYIKILPEDIFLDENKKYNLELTLDDRENTKYIKTI